MTDLFEPVEDGTRRAPKSEDLRVIKTKRMLTASMFALLNRKQFGEITVNNLCETAAVSRATFYSHFRDKYDLLRYCLKCVCHDFTHHINDSLQLETVVMRFLSENSRLVINLVDCANYETLEILFGAMVSFVRTFARHRSPNNNIDYLLLHFCAGGMVSLQFWCAKNNFEPRAQTVTPFIIRTLEKLTKFGDQAQDE